MGCRVFVRIAIDLRSAIASEHRRKGKKKGKRGETDGLGGKVILHKRVCVENGGRGRIAVECERRRNLEDVKSQKKHAKTFIPFPFVFSPTFRTRRDSTTAKTSRKRQKWEKAQKI